MNGYIALKNTVFNGVGYLAGSIVPEDAVLPSRVPSLLRTGVLSRVENGADSPQTGAEQPAGAGVVSLPILTEDGGYELSVTYGDIAAAVTVLQMKQDDAVAAVAEVLTENALILIDACTRNKTIEKAVRDRAAVLRGEAGEE